MVLEITTFRLATGVDEGDFVDADHRFQTEFIPNHPGFMRRTAARAPDGGWVVVTLWDGTSDAEASRARWDGDPVVEAFVALIEPGSLRMKRYEDLGG